MELTRKQLKDLAQLVAHTAPNELDCGAVLNRLAVLLEKRAAPMVLTPELQEVAQHLRVCPECHEEFQLLLETYELN